MVGMERFSVSAPGQIVNDYRIRGGNLELRTKNPELKLRRNIWRKLETDEVMVHLLLHTVVGRWLMERRGFHMRLATEGFPSTDQVRKQAA